MRARMNDKCVYQISRFAYWRAQKKIWLWWAYWCIVGGLGAVISYGTPPNCRKGLFFYLNTSKRRGVALDTGRLRTRCRGVALQTHCTHACCAGTWKSSALCWSGPSTWPHKYMYDMNSFLTCGRSANTVTAMKLAICDTKTFAWWNCYPSECSMVVLNGFCFLFPNDLLNNTLFCSAKIRDRWMSSHQLSHRSQN